MLCIVQGTWQHICCCSSDVGSWCSRLLVRLVGLGLWPQAGRRRVTVCAGLMRCVGSPVRAGSSFGLCFGVRVRV